MQCYKCTGTGKLKITVYTGKMVDVSTLTCVWCDGKGEMSAERYTASKKADDSWCKCETRHGTYHVGGFQDMYLCEECHKIVQIG